MNPKKVNWVMKNSNGPFFNLWEAHCFNGNKYLETFEKGIDPNDILPYGHSYGIQLSAADYKKYYLKYVRIEKNNIKNIDIERNITTGEINSDHDMARLLDDIEMSVNLFLKGE